VPRCDYGACVFLRMSSGKAFRRPLVGTLFRSPGAHAAVIVLGGSQGGIDENRAAIIASHGLDAFALGYFGATGLPDALADIPVETVERAVRWMRAQPDLRSPPIVVEGDSKGAELALVAASHNRDLCAVVAFAPSSQVFEGFSTSKGARRASWTIDGTPLPYADNPMPSPVKMQIRAARLAHAPVSFRGQYLALATPPKENSTIPVWEIAGPLLLIAGRDDQLWPSDIFARRILDERAAHQSSFRDSALIFNHAGHQIDVPYIHRWSIDSGRTGFFGRARRLATRLRSR
jgi:acetyl esterase/lipase